MSHGSLEEYLSKRDPSRTPEPTDGGEGAPDEEAWFVVQEHDASSHHFDFRLRVGDVLRSWAVPKGPSTDPSERRLAIPTEDHPLEYAGFEGVIPEGEYGGGTVIVWDAGRYTMLQKEEGASTDIEDELEDGHATFWLDGEKIRGGYALIRTNGGDERWLLVKMDDDEADARRDPVSTEPESVLSGRTLDEVRREEAGGDDQDTDEDG